MKKKIMSLVLELVMCVGLTVPAFAAPTVSDTFQGCAVSGTVTYTNTSATATTRITGATNAVAMATVEAYFEKGSGDYYKEAVDQQTNGYAVATARVDVSGAIVRGAMGHHTVFYNNQDWQPSAPTSAGVILWGATEWVESN